MTHTIAISNHKGGVAKTTSCISLGACLAEAGLRTLLVDFDPQANLTLALGFEPEELDITLPDLLGSDGPAHFVPTAAIQATSLPGLDLLPADQRLVDLEVSAHDDPDYERCLRNLLASLAHDYDFIIVDCPPSLGALTIMALTAADLALIPLHCDYFAVRGLLNLIAIVEAVKARTNPSLDHALFVSMYDSRPMISRRILDQLRSNYPDRLLQTVIGLDVRLRESAMANEPITVFARKTRAAGQYRALAGELVQLLE